MTYYIKRGDQFSISSENAIDLHTKLPAGNYTISVDQFGTFSLIMTNSFSLPNKLYGDTIKHRDRIINTFTKRPNSTGVLLAGEKGSGKSLLAKALSIRSAELYDIPTIIINVAYCGDGFNQFIQGIDQPCIILFDEFEKVYKSEQQELVLTLLDGTVNSKKLFVMTCNNKWRIDSNMKNRPGRLFYLIEYKGLSVDFIREYCDDNLINKEYIDSLCKISSLYDEFNFDMLSSVVEEMNRYDESPQQVLDILNAKPGYEKDSVFIVKLFIDNVEIDPSLLYSRVWSGNPLTNFKNIEYGITTIDESDSTPSTEWDNYARFENHELVKINDGDLSFVFKNENNDTLVLSKQKERPTNYFGAF